jgi:sRNA-binding protein
MPEIPTPPADRPAAAAEPAVAPDAPGIDEPAVASGAAAPKAVPDLPPAACAAALAARFPALFGARVLPIKLRIQADIQTCAPGVFSRKALSIFLHRHTTSTAYLKALMQSAQRHDLDGAAAGDISDEHRQAAAAELERRRGIALARQAAEREAERQQRQATREQCEREQAALAARQAAENEVRRERAALLRAYETSTLTRANFCALKGWAEESLEAELTLARQEREQRSAEAQREDRSPGRPPVTPREPRPRRRAEAGEPAADSRSARPASGRRLR